MPKLSQLFLNFDVNLSQKGILRLMFYSFIEFLFFHQEFFHSIDIVLPMV